MKFVLVLLMSLVNTLVESRKNKRRKVDNEDHKEPLHPAAFSLR